MKSLGERQEDCYEVGPTSTSANPDQNIAGHFHQTNG